MANINKRYFGKAGKAKKVNDERFLKDLEQQKKGLKGKDPSFKDIPRREDLKGSNKND